MQGTVLVLQVTASLLTELLWSRCKCKELFLVLTRTENGLEEACFASICRKLSFWQWLVFPMWCDNQLPFVGTKEVQCLFSKSSARGVITMSTARGVTKLIIIMIPGNF